MFTLLNKVKKRDWNYAAAEVYKNKRRFRKRIKHIRWFTIILLHLHYYLDLYTMLQYYLTFLRHHFKNTNITTIILSSTTGIYIDNRLDLKTKVEYQHFWKITYIVIVICYGMIFSIASVATLGNSNHVPVESAGGWLGQTNRVMIIWYWHML